MMNWSDEEDMLYFINMYRARRSLWDPTDSQYKNKYKRHALIMEIATIFGIQKIDVEKKIKNLRSQFARERKRVIETRRYGPGRVYESKWFAYRSLMFLVDRNKQRNIQDSEGSQDREDEIKKEDNVGNENADPVEISDSDMEEHDDAIISALHEKTFNALQKPIRKRKVNSTPAANYPIINEAVNLLRNIQSKKKDKDEYDLFGEQVAIRLRNIASPHAKFAAQQNINKTLFEAEMGMEG